MQPTTVATRHPRGGAVERMFRETGLRTARQNHIAEWLTMHSVFTTALAAGVVRRVGTQRSWRRTARCCTRSWPLSGRGWTPSPGAAVTSDHDPSTCCSGECRPPPQSRSGARPCAGDGSARHRPTRAGEPAHGVPRVVRRRPRADRRPERLGPRSAPAALRVGVSRSARRSPPRPTTLWAQPTSRTSPGLQPARTVRQ